MLEFFSMLRTNADVTVEYEDRDQLKRMRLAYVLHICDYLLSERRRIASNNALHKKINDEGKLTLENVFELAGEGKNEAEDQDDAESSAEEQKEGEGGDERLAEGNILKPASNHKIANEFKKDEKDDEEDCLKDQGFTRAKVLIVVGFRHMAFDIV